MALPSPLERPVAQFLHWARILKRDIAVVHLAARDPRVPWHAKLVAAAVARHLAGAAR